MCLSASEELAGVVAELDFSVVVSVVMATTLPAHADPGYPRDDCSGRRLRSSAGAPPATSLLGPGSIHERDLCSRHRPTVDVVEPCDDGLTGGGLDESVAGTVRSG